MTTLENLKAKRNRFISDLAYEDCIELNTLIEEFGLEAEDLYKLKLIVPIAEPDPLDAYHFTLTEDGKSFFDCNEEFQIYFLPVNRLQSLEKFLCDRDIEYCNEAFEKYFRFSKEDLRGIKFALDIAKSAQRMPLTGRQIVALGVFVMALEDFPRVTEDAFAEIDINLRAGGGTELEYVSISIEYNNIIFSSGGCIDSGFGSDSFSNDNYVISNYNRNNSVSIQDYLDRFSRIINNGGKIEVGSDCSLIP